MYVEFLHSPRYLPRKGTETPLNTKSCYSPNNIRHDIYPARGRKRCDSVMLLAKDAISIRHDIYPARGRKRLFA